ncbi:MAG: LD-carboxypeptidase [Erysipelotrichaceae bacterium]|nr:LD-carboxypeptidase [Erysipelotrichaceae bacterium]
MRQPKFLKDGDLITLVAPSFGCVIEPYLTRLDVSIARLRKAGYRVEEGPNIRRADGVACSASGEERAKEIQDAFASEAKLILSVGGGETMCEMLPYLDFEALKKGEPKWFMGFSDNTNLTFLLPTLANMMAIYGPCAGQFFQKKWRLSEKDAMRMLHGETHFEGYPKWSISRRNEEHPLWGYRLSQPKIIVSHQYEGPFEGTLLGGCLDCLANLCGTRFDQVKKWNRDHPEGTIWFLEACDLNALAIRRAYFELREAGWFDNAKGFLIGRALSGREEILGVDRFNAATDMLGGLGVPILMDVDLGHLSPSMPIKTGAKAKVSYENENLIIDYLE